MCGYEVLCVRTWRWTCVATKYVPCVRTWRWTCVATKYCVLGPGGGHVWLQSTVC